MKINFPLPTDNRRHRYCQNCLSEKVHDVQIEGKNLYHCDHCLQTHDRLIDIDPKLVSWVDEKTQEYWHESVGVFVFDLDRKFLLIERTIYPYGLTIPSGHLESGELPRRAAERELFEETGIKTKKLVFFKQTGVPDLCRRGADFHRWNIFTLIQSRPVKIVTNKHEGKNPVWVNYQKVLQQKLAPPVRYLILKFGNQLAGY